MTGALAALNPVAMTLHLVKLCVGAGSIEDLQAWIDFRVAENREAGRALEQIHTTRMTPTRRDELLSGGSLYWVIKGSIQARQRLLDIRSYKDDEGVGRCDIVMAPDLTPTQLQPRRPFQGWRYLKVEDAPADLSTYGAGADIPEEMRRELAELCLI